MKARLLVLAIFSLAFAFVEAAVVIYLQQITPLEELRKLSFLKSPESLFQDPWLLWVEQTRELATIVILGTIAWIWGKIWKERILAFIFSFSVWDLGYYFFLNRTVGWPTNLFDVDVFFLVPVPWVGPVILPLIVFSVLLVISGTVLLKRG